MTEPAPPLPTNFQPWKWIHEQKREPYPTKERDEVDLPIVLISEPVAWAEQSVEQPAVEGGLLKVMRIPDFGFLGHFG